MQIVERGILNRGEPGSVRAASTFPALTTLADGSLLATYRAGSNKDSADGTVELRRRNRRTAPIARRRTNVERAGRAARSRRRK